MGSQVTGFSYGCLYVMIGLIVLLFFPIFFLCSDCCKKRIYNLFNINLNVYEAMGKIIQNIRPTECFIVIQDNFFNEAKCNAIAKGLQKSYAIKFELVNISTGLNAYGHNYSDFCIYARQLKSIVRKTKCRWGNMSI